MFLVKVCFYILQSKPNFVFSLQNSSQSTLDFTVGAKRSSRADICVVCCRMRWRSSAVRCWRCVTCSRRRRCTSCRSCGCSWSRPTKPAAFCSTACARLSAAASGWLRRDRWTGSWSGAWSTISRSEVPLPPQSVHVCLLTVKLAQHRQAVKLSIS